MSGARIIVLFGALAAALSAAAAPAFAAGLVPYRALYKLTLASSKSGSDVVAASGAEYDEVGETCDGWTEQQRLRLRFEYGQEPSVDITSNLVTWEAKDGLRYQFDQRRQQTGEADEEIQGEARLDGPGKGGTVDFEKPKATKLTLAPGVLFPTAHTIELITRASAGDELVTRRVFDGDEVANASQVTAVIGPALAPGAADGSASPLASPLLAHKSWSIRLAYFPPDDQSGVPDFEQTVRLVDNGVAQEMLMDYGDYAIRATLTELEPLPRPSC